LEEPLLCPVCQEIVLALTRQGHCLACGAPLAARYLAVTDDNRWLADPGSEEQRQTLVRGTLISQGAHVRLVYQLAWW
jgi:hypothetical protein